MEQKSPNINLASQEYWDEAYGKLDFQVAPRDHVVREWFETFIPGGDGRCLEIGCFPGQFLACLGELGYQLNGLDLIPAVETALPQWLKSRGYRVGRFYMEDFLNFDPGDTFDIVSSFGFLEHFTHWEDVLLRHIRLVKEGGYLIVSAPNFRGGFQRFFQSVFNRESYKRHNINAMDPEAWAEIIRKQGFEILFSGYYGSIYYWANEQKRNILAKLSVHFFIDILLPVLTFLPLPKHRKFYSPICGVIARRVEG
jgi:SAM-dependent methyltransferase